jgi:putative CocE/NonD family hydrolase
MDLSKTPDKLMIPALHISGWYDTYLEGSLEGFNLLRARAGSAHARENQYLLAGPWIHIPWGDRAGEAQLGPEALLDTDTILLHWFDHWLKDAQTFSTQPRVRHFALGANRWFAADTAHGDSETTLYLHSQGRAESRKGDGTLSQLQAQSEPCDVFVYDPEVPVLSPGGALAFSGQFDQAALESGNNILVYTSDPLRQALHVYGAPRVVIFAATSAVCADLTAKLVRVTSDRAEFCCVGIARSTYLFADDYAADQIHRWEFTLESTSYLFAEGDRVRLEIAGGAFPLYDRNPSNHTKPSEMSQWNWQRSTHFIYHDADHASALYLPVIA